MADHAFVNRAYLSYVEQSTNKRFHGEHWKIYGHITYYLILMKHSSSLICTLV